MEHGMQYTDMPPLRRPRDSWGLPHGPKKDTDLNKSQIGIQSSLTTVRGSVTPKSALPFLGAKAEPFLGAKAEPFLGAKVEPFLLCSQQVSLFSAHAPPLQPPKEEVVKDGRRRTHLFVRNLSSAATISLAWPWAPDHPLL